jgi:hypothetical protein
MGFDELSCEMINVDLFRDMFRKQSANRKQDQGFQIIYVNAHAKEQKQTSK